MKVCTIDGCEKAVIARGLCSTDYAAARRRGEIKVREHHPRREPLDRIMQKIDTSGGPNACWPWTGAHNGRGYGLTYLLEDSRRRAIGAHRAIYVLTYGDLPPDVYVLHSCDNPPCCNPAHLRSGTPMDNMNDRHRSGRSKPNGTWLPQAPRVEPQTVAAIRAAYRPGVKGYSTRGLAARFGLSRDQIGDIVNYRGRWAESA